MGRTVSGPGRMGSVKAVKKSLKKGGNSAIRIIPKEDSLTVRFLEEPEDFFGYYEHFVGGNYKPCTTGDCEGCDSDNPEEQRKNFRYLANAYVVDDQKVQAVKMPKSLVEMLMTYHTKYGTLRDRDYELSRTGSGQNDTRYMSVPEAPSKMRLSRFEDKMHDLSDILASLVDEDDDDDDDEPPRKKRSSSKPSRSKSSDPWEDDDEDDDEDEPPRRRKSTTAKKKSGTTVKRRTVKRK